MNPDLKTSPLSGPPVRPIFVVGAPRSGTTLLRFMLSGHSRIYIPPESNFIPRFFQRRPGLPMTHSRAVQIMRSLRDYRMFFRDWCGPRPDPEVFVNGLPNLFPATLLDRLYGDYARQYGASRWGDKSPNHTCQMDLLASLFPGAQFIHIIRDARDVALSMREAYRGLRFFYMDAYYEARSWKERVSKARASGTRLGPGRYFEVRFMNITTEPELYLRQICDFLGETYEPSMSQPQKVAIARHHSNGIHASTRHAPNARHVGHWRWDMAPTDIRLFQAVLADLLKDLNYDILDLGPMPLREHLRHAALHAKYTLIDIARRATQAAGVFHPTRILSRFLKNPRRIQKAVPHVTTCLALFNDYNPFVF